MQNFVFRTKCHLLQTRNQIERQQIPVEFYYVLSMLQKTLKVTETKWCEKESGVKVDIFIAMDVSGQ